MKLMFCLLALIVVSSAFGELYRGHQLFRIEINEEDDAHIMHKLGEANSEMLDFWTVTVPGRPMDVMVSSDFVDEFVNVLAKRKLSYEVIMTDVQDVIDKEAMESRKAREGRKKRDIMALEDFDYSIYHTYDEIAAPGEPGASDPKPVVYFEGGIHSREWVSPATVMYFTGKFLRRYMESDPEAVRTLGMFDLHIVPLLNCDGYNYTWTSNRLWRTSRKLNPDFGCIGTDLNRNFNAFWGGEGASPWPCSIIFRGFTDLDNVETQAIDNHFQKLKENNRVTKVFIDWHSYSQLILAPWSYDADIDPPIDTDKQIAAAGAMAKAMNETNNVPGGYIHGVGTDILYVSSGTSKDYGYASTPQATYSYTVELRDKGQFGFLLPANQIIPTGNESYYGVIGMLDWIYENDYN
ncbi:putative carboxypeptidase B [Apostichopus japonicus]|uniref:Putative carboxypeptidase B n=1 Tax=Stichopus japonicus TaxID=307972 RepID=A0A2G8LF98_STIJA|nr:putative carboxypeptidase B [Apostichopus japonicus]